jgi:glycosyltransferase involved in cell wall biosynthesis
MARLRSLRLAVVGSHPVQYYAPLFRALAGRLDLTVFYAHRATPADQARAGFGVGFDWDLDLLSGYDHEFLENVARRPGLDRFLGVDTPQIVGRLRAGRFDAVLLMGWHLKCFHQALWAAMRLHLPVLMRGDSHLDTPRAAWKRWAKAMAYPVFLRRFDAALVVGQRNRAYWRRYGYPEPRIFDAPHCVDNDWFAAHATRAARSELRARLGVAPNVKLALFAGKLVSFKRPLDLVEATAQVRAAGAEIEILVAGAGPLEPDLRARAAALGIPLHVLGFCNQTEMPAAYAAADLLVLPSDGRETWGLVVNEALACGRPILISDAVGCAPDMAAQLGDGAIFPMGDIRALAARLREALASPPNIELIEGVKAAFSLGLAVDGVIAAAYSVSRG